MKLLELAKEYSHWVMFYEDVDDTFTVYHLVGFYEEPNAESIMHIKEEVKNDPEFGLGDFADTLSVKVMPAGPEMNDLIKHMEVEENDDE